MSGGKGETDNLRKKLAVLKKEIDSYKKVEKKAYDRLLDPEYEEDEGIKERLRSIKKKIQDHEQTKNDIEFYHLPWHRSRDVSRLFTSINFERPEGEKYIDQLPKSPDMYNIHSTDYFKAWKKRAY
jgi:hypothetical protein